MKKKILSLLLTLCMVSCLMPATAFAEGGAEEMPACTCETACTPETMNAECPVCGTADASAEICGKYTGSAAENTVPQPEEVKADPVGAWKDLPEETKAEQGTGKDLPETQSEAAPEEMHKEEENPQEKPAGETPVIKPQSTPEPINGEAENSIAAQGAGIAVDAVSFPDEAFLNRVKSFDKDSNGSLSGEEIAAVKEIYCYERGISDLTGIGYFTALETLQCYGNQLTVLDVSQNTNLKELKCYDNKLTSLDVSGNSVLTRLYCYNNQLSSLNVGGCINLNDLMCFQNRLTALDVSQNPNLEKLQCDTNQLTVLDVSQNARLNNLGCYDNPLTSLDISGTSLNYLYYDNYQGGYQIEVNPDRTFDLSALPGNFDVRKASGWTGGTVSGNTLTADADKGFVIYQYDCGKGQKVKFKLQYTKAVQKYDLYVDGEQFTSEKLSINRGIGTVTYDPATMTLALNNATIDHDITANYGIKASISDTLKIRLTGANTITRTDTGGGGGIYSDHAVEIIGDGTLAIQVEGATYDGIVAGTDLRISDKAKVTINSKGGLGILSEGMVEIDGATVDSTGLYAGIDACGLKIIDGADVTLKATQDNRNGAFIRKDQEGNGGHIEIARSTAKATSYYPGLYAEGNLTVNGGEVTCTSTADAAIWAKGDILVKGGAKVTTDGKYPMGGNGTFTVEEAEIDAKNTDENNIPAIFDECIPVITDGYQLTYAKAVDSEGTEIDLLSSGTQYFALYKNVHFITKAVYPVTFIVTPDGLTNVVVKVDGQAVTGPVSLVAGTYQIEVTADHCKTYSGSITIAADTATHTQTIAMTYLPADYTKADAALSRANALKKDDYKDFSGVEAAVNAIVRSKNITEQTEVDAMAKAIEDAIAALQYKDADYTKVDAALARANALKKKDYKDFSGVEAAVNAVVRSKNITEQTEVDAMAKAIEDAIAALKKKPSRKKSRTSDKSPQMVTTSNSITSSNAKPETLDKSPHTGDTSNPAFWIALLFISGGAGIGITVVRRKKKYNK